MREFAQTKDGLWGVDRFRCESILPQSLVDRDYSDGPSVGWMSKRCRTEAEGDALAVSRKTPPHRTPPPLPRPKHGPQPRATAFPPQANPTSCISAAGCVIRSKLLADRSNTHSCTGCDRRRLTSSGALPQRGAGYA
jgi:hypothetical protein